MQGWYHSLLAMQSRRPAWAMGLRMAVIVVAPLVVGLLTGKLGMA
jgi:hypothetical protein